MPRRELEKKFSSELVNSEFSFIPRGIHPLKEIYELVRTEFFELCDYDFKCKDCCKSGGPDPEWRHILRGVLGSRSRVVRKGPGRGNWEFF